MSTVYAGSKETSKGETRVAECLHELFEAQVDKSPSTIALQCGDLQWSYEELDCRANQIARFLRSQGVGPGEYVGLYLHRSETSVVAILAVLKAGAAYVPIDPAFPDKRARHISSEAKIRLVLSERCLREEAEEKFRNLRVFAADDEVLYTSWSTEKITRAETGVSPENLCYVLYTSGSTGRAKGVMTEHRNVVRFVHAFNEVLQLTPEDRVYHGFALGFDGSVEEMWMAYSNGARLVVGTADISRIGNEAAKLLSRHGVTVFSTVPTSLGMLQNDVPSLRLIILSGEPCPPELIKKWASADRRMLNVYGPTETTVNATAAECVPDQPVTIGQPLSGYDALILDEQMQPVPNGQSGELYIGGIGLARGYIGQEDLTRKHFVANPFSRNDYDARLYRTGDLVERTATGDFLFHGRIDRQVKVRGYRIELSEIESVLREHDRINQAVVSVVETQGRKELAAYVVPQEQSSPLDRDDVLQWLRDHTPHYMVPNYLEELDHLPTLPSGKADRNHLPAPSNPLVPVKRPIVEPQDELQRNILSVWQKKLNTSPLSIEDDFFIDLGGYSLLAVETVSELRAKYGLKLSLRDLYNNPTVAQLSAFVNSAQHLREETADNAKAKSPEEKSKERKPQASSLARCVCYTLQAISVTAIYGLASLPALLTILLTIALFKLKISIGYYVLYVSLVVFALPVLGILFSVAVKWAVVGRYRPGEYPLWSFYYFRWWLVTRTQFLAWTDIYLGSPLINLYYRMMGAKIGKGCVLDTNRCAAFDLLEIGNDTCVGAETHILGYRVEDGLLKIGTIKIGNRCYVGSQCALGLDTEMGDDACLDDMSLLHDRTTMPAGTSWKGSPAQVGQVDLPRVESIAHAKSRPFLFGLLHFLASELVGELLLLAVLFPVSLVAFLGYFLGGAAWVLGSLLLGIPFCVIWFCVFMAASKAFLTRSAKPGTYPVSSWTYLERWSAELLFRYASGLIYPLYTTVFLPAWLRLCGAKVRSRAEVSTVTHLIPELVTIGEESFLADGCLIGGKRLYRGCFQLAENHIGSRSFIGNGAMLPVGATVGNNCLVGVLSLPESSETHGSSDNLEWLGSPPFRLPFRKKMGGFDESTTFRPTWKLYLLRCTIDALRILTPYYIALFSLAVFATAVAFGSARFPLWAVLALAPFVAAATVAFSLLQVVTIKQVIMGTHRPVVKPLWSTYVWLNELVNGAHETVALALLEPMLGTPFACWYLRAMGCKIGKRVFIETELFSEFDLVEIDDNAALNAGSVMQNHLFEDRIMKSSYLKVGRHCSVGNLSVVLYDTEMKQGSSIGPLSLLMKGDTVEEGTRWIGIPTTQENPSS